MTSVAMFFPHAYRTLHDVLPAELGLFEHSRVEQTAQKNDGFCLARSLQDPYMIVTRTWSGTGSEQAAAGKGLTNLSLTHSLTHSLTPHYRRPSTCKAASDKNVVRRALYYLSRALCPLLLFHGV